jgi:glycosyltransferase involved in cell wall biosynthesis
VQAQSCQDIEHIFVDGGSTDATLDLIDAYPLARKLLLRNVRGGIGRAMNQGLAAASGGTVAHLHSDDYYAAGDVLACVAARLACSGRDWLYGAIAVLRDGSLSAPHAIPPFSYFSLAAGKAFIPHPATFVRRSLFARAGGFDESLKYAMDIDLWLRLAALGAPVTVDRPLAVFREHAGSLSSANKIAARQEEFRVRQRYLASSPLAFGIYCLRHLKRMRALRRAA